MKRWTTAEGSVELRDDSIVVWFDRGSGRKRKAIFSPRRFPLTAVQDVEAWTSWKHNCYVVTLRLVGAQPSELGPRLDPNSFLVPLGKGRAIARALRTAVLSAEPKTPAPELLVDARSPGDTDDPNSAEARSTLHPAPGVQARVPRTGAAPPVRHSGPNAADIPSDASQDVVLPPLELPPSDT